MEEKMMESHSLRRGRPILAVLVCVAVGLLASASSAFAVQSGQYDAFLDSPACPTDNPLMNNPEFPEVACMASSAGHISLTIGDLETEVSSPAKLGFALTFGGGEPEVCPGVEACFRSVPGSTVADIDPIKIDLSPRGHHGPPHFPSPPRGPHKPWYGNGNPWHGHGGIFHGHRRLLHGSAGPSIKATMEPAGDLHAFTLASGPGTSIPLFRMPLKVHLEGPLLGGNCYIGSNANPIEFAAVPITEPELAFLPDPNGLPVLTLLLNGLDTADNTFAVPAAQGCGPVVRIGRHRYNSLDGAINAALDLPSPAGKNLMVLTESNSTFVIATGGASTAGGAGLKAAFAAAQQP